MTIKKSYAELVNFLEENKNKKVSTILDEIKEMTQQKTQTKTFILDSNDEVFAIYCYYHKQYELLSETEYGKKASSTTGFNTMCKIGVREWTRQQNAIKKVDLEVLSMIEDGTIELSEIGETKARLIAELKEIKTDGMPIGYTEDEILEILNK